MEKKKVVIFGATGNTGSYLVEYLKENLDSSLYEIVALSRNATSFNKKQEVVIVINQVLKVVNYLYTDVYQKEDFLMQCLK